LSIGSFKLQQCAVGSHSNACRQAGNVPKNLNKNTLISNAYQGILYLSYLEFERFMWLPELVARRTSGRQEITLLVKLSVRRGKGGFIQLS